MPDTKKSSFTKFLFIQRALVLIGAIMATAVTMPRIRRKPELLGHGIHNEHCI